MYLYSIIMPRLHKLPPEQIKNAIKDYKNGLAGQRLADKYDMSRTGMYEMLDRHGVMFRSHSESKRKYMLDENFFNKINTEEKAYMLGFIYGDGYVSTWDNNLGITGLSTDDQIFKDMAKILKSDRPLIYKESAAKNGSVLCVFSVCSLTMRQDINKLGVIPNKTKTIKFPSQHMDSSLYRHFIRGLFDADGCITATKDVRCKNRWYALWNISSTKEMLEDIKTVLEERGIMTNALTKDKRCYSNSAILGTAKASTLHDIYHFLYDNSCICLKRKQKRFEEILKLKPKEGIRLKPLK